MISAMERWRTVLEFVTVRLCPTRTSGVQTVLETRDRSEGLLVLPFIRCCRATLSSGIRICGAPSPRRVMVARAEWHLAVPPIRVRFGSASRRHTAVDLS